MPAAAHRELIEDLTREYSAHLKTYRPDLAIKEISSLGFVIALDKRDAALRRSPAYKENSYFTLHVYCGSEAPAEIPFFINQAKKFILAGVAFASLPELLEEAARELERKGRISKDALFWKKAVPLKEEAPRPLEIPVATPAVEIKQTPRPVEVKIQKDEKLEGFFAKWYAAALFSDRVALYKKFCDYSPLSSAEVRDFIQVSKINRPDIDLSNLRDGVVREEIESDFDDQQVDYWIDPYLVDRVFMHAMSIEPKKWDPEFTQHFRMILNFLTTNQDLFEGNDANLMRTSYRPVLAQMQYLERHRQISEWRQRHFAREEKEDSPKALPRPPGMLLLPHQVQTLAELDAVSAMLDKERKTVFLKDLHERHPCHYIKMVLKQDRYQARLNEIQRQGDEKVRQALLLMQQDYPVPAEQELHDALQQLFASDQETATNKGKLGWDLQFEQLPESVYLILAVLIATAQTKRAEEEKRVVEESARRQRVLAESSVAATVSVASRQPSPPPPSVPVLQSARPALPPVLTEQDKKAAELRQKRLAAIQKQAARQEQKQGDSLGNPGLPVSQPVPPSRSTPVAALLSPRSRSRRERGVGNLEKRLGISTTGRVALPVPAPRSGTPRWKLGLAVVGLILGGLFLASGFGSVAGAVILGFSLASIETAATVALFVAGSALILGCFSYLAQAAYQACRRPRSAEPTPSVPASQTPADSSLPTASPSPETRPNPPSPRSGQRSQPLAPPSVSDVSIFKDSSALPVAPPPAVASPAKRFSLTPGSGVE